MRPDDFVKPIRGQLTPIEDGWAFIPEPLPPPLTLGWQLVRSLDAASVELGQLVGQARQHTNTTLFTQPLLFREAGESSRIEGIQTRAADVLLQEAGLAPENAAQQHDNIEVLNYLDALRSGEGWIQEGRPISLFFVRGLHKTLLEGARGGDKHPGEFRRRTVWIGQRGDTPLTARYVPPPWEHVEPAVEGLVSFIAAEDSELPSLITAALLHYQFEAIHPFEDGNGRLGRLLLPLYLMERKVLDRPLLVLSPYFEAHRDEYMERLARVSTHGDWDAWLSFFLGAVREQALAARLLIDRVEEIRARYRSLVAERVKTRGAYLALDVILDRVVVSPREVAILAGVSANTARAILDGLHHEGIIQPVPRSRAQRWWAKDLIDAVYERPGET